MEKPLFHFKTGKEKKDREVKGGGNNTD